MASMIKTDLLKPVPELCSQDVGHVQDKNAEVRVPPLLQTFHDDVPRRQTPLRYQIFSEADSEMAPQLVAENTGAVPFVKNTAQDAAGHARKLRPSDIARIKLPPLTSGASFLRMHFAAAQKQLLNYDVGFIGMDGFFHVHNIYDLDATMLLVDSLKSDQEVFRAAQRIAAKSNYNYRNVVDHLLSRFCDLDMLREEYEKALSGLVFRSYDCSEDFILQADEIMYKCEDAWSEDSSERRSLIRLLLSRLPEELNLAVQKDLARDCGFFSRSDNSMKSWDRIEWDKLRSLIRGHAKVFQRVGHSVMSDRVQKFQDTKNSKPGPQKPKKSGFVSDTISKGLFLAVVFGAGLTEIPGDTITKGSVSSEKRFNKAGRPFYLVAYTSEKAAQDTLNEFKTKYKNVGWDTHRSAQKSTVNMHPKGQGKSH
jgi:hypothetical protein